MKKDLTEIVFIVDRSYSMEKIRKDMIGGFNSFIKEQKQVPNECKVSFYQFDDHVPTVEKVYEQVAIANVTNLTHETFVPRGNTPLYDAVATVIRTVGGRLDKTEESQRPEKVLVVCITDGEENSSTEWDSAQVKQMIEHQQEKFGWEFCYLGSNQDAWAVGAGLGIKAGSTLGYVASKGGTDALWKSLSNKTAKYRASGAVRSVDFDEQDREAQKAQGYKV